MAKQSGTFDLILPRRKKGMTAQRWLCEGLRWEILSGRLPPGAQLPASRDLAAQYGVSRGTVVIAFEQLQSEGYVQGSPGSGTFVSAVLPEELLQVRRQTDGGPVKKRAYRADPSAWARRVDLFPNFEDRPTRAFRANLPALDLFPTTLWAQVAARRLRRVSTSLLMGCEAMGYMPLRRAISDYLVTSRGVRCTPEQIAIVSGVQEAIDLVTRIIVNPGDRVCVESPGYLGAVTVFKSAGAELVYAPVDDEGLRLREHRIHGVRLVYVTPGHQFPTGVTMSVARRIDWLEWAARSEAWILEDDYDTEFRYSGSPVPAMQGLDKHGVVLFTGSFSKVLFPSLRLGYLVVPEDLVDRVAATLSITSRHAPLLEQAVVCDFITEGHFGRHLRRMRQIYAERLAALFEAANEFWPRTVVLSVSPVQAGLQTVAHLLASISDDHVTMAAAKRNVEVVPVRHYNHLGASTTSDLQLGFAAIDEKEIRRGARELAAAVCEVAGLS